MPSCCYADEYGQVFSDGAARRTARRYLRRGLQGSAKLLADGVAAAGIAGASILEVGGGVGQIHADLVRRGAAGATNVELSPNWESAADGMLTELGLRERVQRHVADFVDAVGELPDADVVLLHRVVCCYPDCHAMLTAATAKARRVVGITLPPDHWGARLGVGIGNGLLALRKQSFRAFIHPWDRVITTLEGNGFRPVIDHRQLIWRTLVAQRVGEVAAA